MSKVYMQFSNCIVVKGFNRSAIYDLHRMRYLFVTNYFADILLNFSYKIPLKNLDTDLEELLDELVEDDWGIYLNDNVSNLFPPLDLFWDSYSSVTNAQIDLCNNEEKMSYFINMVLPQFEELLCKDFQFNFISSIPKEGISNFLDSINNTSVNSINLVLPYIELKSEEIDIFFEIQPRLNSLFFYSAPYTEYKTSGNHRINYTCNNLDIRANYAILTEYFNVNIQLFTESQKHNTYFNRKLCIDVNGNIKNSPENEQSFGNIQSTGLKNAIENDGFREFWYVNKEKIDVCSDCEFKHMCVDACIPIKRFNGSWFRKKECDYNPYISKWKNEEGYKSLKECGVIISFEGFEIDTDKLNQVNKEIWVDN